MSPPSAQDLEIAPIASRRYHSLDALRAVMMLLGLALHAACSYTTFPMHDSWLFKDRQTTHWADATLLTIHTFRMPVFMVMAGFFAALLAEGRGTRGFVGNRARRVMVPFMVSFVLLMPLVKWAAFYAQSVGEGVTAPAADGLRRALSNPFFSSLAHLWFLYDLLLFYAAVVLLRLALSTRLRQAVSRWFLGAMGKNRRLGVLPFFAVTVALCLFSPDGSLETSMTFLPNFPVLGVYFAFFGFGWLLYGARECLPLLQERLLSKGALLLVLMALHIALLAQGPQLFAGPYGLFGLVASAAAGMGAAWVGFSFWTGLFMRHFTQPSAIMRYLTDASYAVYLVHLPLVYLAAGRLASWRAPAAFKMSAVVLVVAATSLGFYATCVRRTFVGQALNGRRARAYACRF
jgi:glucan biosynthesis protein C